MVSLPQFIDVTRLTAVVLLKRWCITSTWALLHFTSDIRLAAAIGAYGQCAHNRGLAFSRQKFRLCWTSRRSLATVVLTGELGTGHGSSDVAITALPCFLVVDRWDPCFVRPTGQWHNGRRTHVRGSSSAGYLDQWNEAGSKRSYTSGRRDEAMRA